ncbi:MAG: fasciclin domain-containing protein [Candidatus Kapaibacterium sp.]
MAADLSNTYVNTLAVGPNDENVSLQVSTTGGVMFNGSSKPITTDIEASNGVVHTIDKVMLPPNIVTLALNNPNFSILVQALTDGRHQADFVAILNAAGPYTVFAPTNAAFEALLASNPSWNSLADIPIETLAAVLSYHVLASANVQSNQLTNNQEITMFSGGKLTVDLTNGAMLKTSSNQMVNISVVDVQGTNGVIHGIDSVLLP